MNKSELSAHVAAETAVARTTADSVVSALFATIAEALARGEKISISGFRTFATRSRAAHQGRNPATGESVAIAASTTPSFKAGKRSAIRSMRGRTDLEPESARACIT